MSSAQKEQQQQNYEDWKQISEKMQTNMQTLSRDYGDVSGDLLVSLKLFCRERTNYREFCGNLPPGEKKLYQTMIALITFLYLWPKALWKSAAD